MTTASDPKPFLLLERHHASEVRRRETIRPARATRAEGRAPDPQAGCQRHGAPTGPKDWRFQALTISSNVRIA